MNSSIPTYIQHAWAFYNSTEELLSNLWESYQNDFLEHYLQEIIGAPEEPEEPYEPDLVEGDDIPF